MKKDGIGPCSQQLYAQFLYRILLMKKIYNLSNINICIYAKSSYLHTIKDVSNSVYKNTTDVFIVSSTSSMAHGISIIPENYFKVISKFSARKLTTNDYANWINDKDEAFSL